MQCDMSKLEILKRGSIKICGKCGEVRDYFYFEYDEDAIEALTVTCLKCSHHWLEETYEQSLKKEKE